MGKVVLIFVVCFLLLIFVGFSSAIKINEFAVDPQSDWDADGDSESDSGDEWIELYNDGSSTVDLNGWTLMLIDSTPGEHLLVESIVAGDHLVVLNPTGTQNNDGRLELWNSQGEMIDSVSYGTWDDGNTEDNALTGNAAEVSDECLARISDGEDSNVDMNDFVKTSCTFGTSNSGASEPPTEPPAEGDSEQGLDVTIAETVTVEITPLTIEFGTVNAGSTNNPSLNGPIMFDASGSNTDVHIEVSNVLGSLFEDGLMLDGNSAMGQFWHLDCIEVNSACTFDEMEVVPTLDIPNGAMAGNNVGTIVYTITGTP